MVGEEEWFGRRSGWAGRIVGKEEWLGRRSCWGGRMVGEEEWLGRTHAVTHVLHAILARTYALHARMASARTHVEFASRPFTHARRACTHALHARMPSLYITHVLHVRTPA